jgi:hypothetical protein
VDIGRSMYQTVFEDIEALRSRGVNIANADAPERELPPRSGSEVARDLSTPYLFRYLIPDQVGKLRFGSDSIHYFTIHVLPSEEIIPTLVLPAPNAIRDHVLLLDPLRMQKRPIFGPRLIRGGPGIEYRLPQGFPREAVVGELEISALQALLGGGPVQPSSQSAEHATAKTRDVFICHASEDKSPVVEPLVVALQGTGVSLWYDRNEIRWGDAITRTINEGLFLARFVLVVMSDASLAKKWPVRELEGVLARDVAEGTNRILPLIHG